MHTSRASTTPEQAKLVTATADIQRVVEQVQQWRTLSKQGSPDDRTLRGWRSELRNLRYSAGRPRTVGVFGESQVGKSYLVSRFATAEEDEEGIQIVDPTDSTGATGLSFLHSLNVSSGTESTAVTCRFSLHPADESKEPGCFVGRVISHVDLLLAIAQGFYWEYQLNESDFREAAENIPAELARLKNCSKISDDSRRDELIKVWESIRTKHPDNKYVGLLTEHGLTELLSDAEFKCPQAEDWLKLAELLWNRQEELTEKYRHLLGLLQGANFPDVIELHKNDCLSDTARGEDDAPIVNVKTLQLERSTTIQVFCRRDGDLANKSHHWTRADVCALLAELTLPVKVPKNQTTSILHDADILDFPGARAASKTRKSKTDEQSDHESAFVAFRRGKLTGMFASLTELNEITLLCLVASPGNKEAGGIVTTLLDRWLEKQLRSSAAGAPPLVLAISKSDQLTRHEPGANSHRFGQAIRDLKGAYVAGSAHDNWMENHGTRGSLFRDIFWVRNPQYPISQGTEKDREFVSKSKREYEEHAEVRKHVADLDKKWDAFVKNGGAGLLADSLRVKIHGTSKVDRLSEAALALVDSVEREISRFHVDSDEVKRRQAKLNQGRRDMEAIASACDSGRPAFAVLLRGFSLSPDKAHRVFQVLDNKLGAVDSSGRLLLVNFDDFWRDLTKGWKEDVTCHQQASGFESRLGLESVVLASVRTHLFASVNLPWMREAVRDALEPFLNASQGAHAFSRGLAETAAAVFNRCLLELGVEPVRPEDPKLPPRLHSEENKPWRWMLRHWQSRLPEVYAESCSPSGKIPEGNEELGRILSSLKDLRAALGAMRPDGGRS